MTYLIATLGYLTSTRERLKYIELDEYKLRFIDYVFIVLKILGTLLFTRYEFMQMKTLGTQYLRVSNLYDVIYLGINYYFIVDLATGVMPEE